MNRMEKYERHRKVLDALLEGHTWIEVDVKNFLHLNVEKLGFMNQVSIAHTRVQNGDLMSVPEVRFQMKAIEGIEMAWPVSYQDDQWAMYQEIYHFDDKGQIVAIDQRARRSVEDFVDVWFKNLKAQGFLKPENKTFNA